jgi:putative ABC transport system ATP-binding protein
MTSVMTTAESPRAVPSQQAPAVVCRDLTKDFGEGETRVRALRGVDLEVRSGEMTLLVGPSGCGKTTLISVIAGLLEPTSGEVRVLGVRQSDLSKSKQVAFRRDNIGFVFQAFNLLPALTAAENASVPLLIAGWKHAKAVARASEILEQMGMGHRLKSLPSQLSGGQQQRVAIARALVHRPRLLVCDEPTSALDHQSGHKIMELLRETALEPDRAVIVVTHDNRVFEFGDRIVHMDDGHVTEIEEHPRDSSPHQPKP